MSFSWVVISIISFVSVFKQLNIQFEKCLLWRIGILGNLSQFEALAGLGKSKSKSKYVQLF